MIFRRMSASDGVTVGYVDGREPELRATVKRFSRGLLKMMIVVCWRVLERCNAGEAYL